MRLGDLDALKKEIENLIGYSLSYEAILNAIDNAPTIIWCSETPEGLPLMDLRERPQGEWIDTGDKNEYWAEEYQCSICGAKDHWHNFCPNCGADMRKGGAKMKGGAI